MVAALLAAQRARTASASWARRSGERLSVLFTLVRVAARLAAASRAASFLFAVASFAFTSVSSFRFNLASFLGPSRRRVSSRLIFFLRVLAFIKERNCLACRWTKGRIELEHNDESWLMHDIV